MLSKTSTHLCLQCGETKADLFYGKEKSKCKKCRSKHTCNRYHNLLESDKIKYKDRVKEYQDNNLFQFRWLSAKNRAKRKGIEFTIEVERLSELWVIQSGLCYYSNIPLVLNRDGIYSMSVDRKDSSIGYTNDNVVLCLTAVNRMKNDLGEADFYYILNQLIIHQKSF